MLIKKIVLIIALFSSGNGFAQTVVYPFLNTKLTFEERVTDLVSRMNLEEKVSQMMYKSAAVQRLGIPSYNWWSGCTHGVGRTKDTVTVYPQSIALAATFNKEEMYITASQISDESRAIHQKTKKEGRFGEQYYGLAMWDPNINIFRDPRWGRGHETYADFWSAHKTHTGKEDAAIDAVLSGTDLECGDENAYHSLIASVNKALIREEDIDVSVNRPFISHTDIAQGG